MNWDKGIDISIPYRADSQAASAWYVGPMQVNPVRMGDWVGAVKEGGSVNFNDLTFNPHGNGTHTECVGHIAPECFSVNTYLTQWMFDCLLITLSPEEVNNDRILTRSQFENAIGDHRPKALAVRTLPNEREKLSRNYSNTNPAYMEASAAAYLAEIGIDHLLLDLPSVDREQDEGALAAHKAFWNYPAAPRMHATITELIYVPDKVVDGAYLLNLQVAPIENDASPSRPVLYPT